ncbi:radical SAM family heme chaperone HemW [Actinomyces sp. B33]|uniref:radical SAM family heme chaperone HemW n=1 Tax=Actinomyces sp. B33 TaxID=2942131 RepID=UPI0023403F02|nr:radical SAM family heme chaperone HemW [Actinomyces sp. B33]MDC4232826.1 radical SAM family heme chaperone HemW [Actinomyces sp. B33]
MSPAQPEGTPWPDDGRLDPALVEADAGRPLSVYVHVPFCSVRCGYCDFNTYTTGFGPGAEPGSYAPSVLAEAGTAVRVLADAGLPARPASTVFFGGGTPTLLDADELAEILDGLRETLGVAAGAEVTVEANPDSVDAAGLARLARAGATRVSFGMQSAVPSVLSILDRTHRPERVPEVVAAARDAGLDVSVDLIYGAPGESLDDWRASLDAALDLAPDHISAYALVVEEGTRMAARIARGELVDPDPDDEAAKYEAADAALGAAGYRWYEISNFARLADGEGGDAGADLAHASRHNLAYWRDWDWWGLGPGAHSHVGRYRWWNVKHPRAYAARARAGSPGAAGEVLDDRTRRLERVMLAVRTAEGVDVSQIARPEAVGRMVAEGLVDPAAAGVGRLVLTLRGRLLADHVVREAMGF